jgi:ABC-2 type transport system ATP-binding protein
LSKAFGGHLAVDGLDLAVGRGIIFGLIGPSGCGKTTTIRMLTGVYQRTSGEAAVLGDDPAHFSRRTRSRIGYMLQQPALYPDLSVMESLRFTRSIYGLSPFRGRIIRDALDFVELTEHRRKRVGDLSGGMQRRLSLASTLLHDPDLIFLDEPTAGVDPVLRLKFWEHFAALREQGRTLFVTTQYVSEAAHCDCIALMKGGQLLALDTPKGLRRLAFGGEMLDVTIDRRVEDEMIAGVQRLGPTQSVQRAGERELRVTVLEASTAIPRIVQYFRDREVDTLSIDEYLPPFDDVFVQLIAQEEERELD